MANRYQVIGNQMEWYKLYSDLPYDKAMLKARRVKDDEAKIRKLGGAGSYADVKMQLTSDLLGRKLYGVYVLPLAAEVAQ